VKLDGGRHSAVGKSAAALVLGVFSRRKLVVLGHPGDGEVVLTGEALMMGCGDRRWHGVRRSRAEAWTRSRVRE
jgi:hypothetical protein